MFVTIAIVLSNCPSLVWFSGVLGVTSIGHSTLSAGNPLSVAALAFRGAVHFGYPATGLNSRVFYPDLSRLPDADDSVRNRGCTDSK